MMWAALLLGEAHAVPVTRAVEICVNYDTEYDDADNDGVASEDFWADNSVDRWARGVEIEVIDNNSSTVLNVSDTTGCTNLSVDVDTDEGEKFLFTVVSRAEVKGVSYEVHEHADLADWTDHSDDYTSETFSASALEVTVERTTSTALAWQVMAASSWMWHRSRFKLTSGVNRACCLEGTGGAGVDGTCTNPAFGYGGPFTGTIHYFIRNDINACGGGNNHQGHLNSVRFDGNCRSKFLYAHENGHLVVGMRMNGIEEYVLDADLDDCMADYWSPSSPIDSGGTFERGMMTKEYTSDAIREGWGEFYSMWAWNSKNHSDCTFWARYQYIDIDLDGTLDNDFAPGSNYEDWQLDCAGSPWMGSDPTPALTDGFNWLDDLEAASDSAGCDRSSLIIWGDKAEYNRAAVWDVARALWDLHSNSSVGTGRLSDLYVDTCPRGWSETDGWMIGGAPNHGSQPLNRFYTSSAFHSSTETAVDDALDDHLLH